MSMALVRIYCLLATLVFLLAASAFGSELYNEAKSGNLENVKKLVSRGIDINETNAHGVSPLYIACARGHKEIARFLMDHGADIHRANVHGSTPLMAAAGKGWEDIVQILISKGTAVNARAKQGVTPIFPAIKSSNTAVIRLLIDHGADVNHPAANGLRPLIYASRLGSKDVVELLVSRGADINPPVDPIPGIGGNAVTFRGQSMSKRSVFPSTPLKTALANKHKEVVFFLIDQGARFNSKEKDGYHEPVLTLALEQGMFDVATMLVDRGAHVNGLTGLPFAVPIMIHMIEFKKPKMLEVIHFLCDHGANPDLVDKHGRTPLMWASKIGKTKVAEFLLSKKAGVDRVDNNGMTPLMFASKEGHSKVVELLLSNHADPNLQSTQKHSSGAGSTALMYAATQGHPHIVKQLIAHGADVNVQDQIGYTPIGQAAARGHLAVAEILMKSGAVIHPSPRGQSAIISALSRNHLDIAQLFVDNGFDLTSEAVKKFLPTYIRVDKRNVLEFFLNNGLDPDDTIKETPLLSEAAKYGKVELMEFFITRGADIDIRGRFGRTPLMVAVQNDQKDAVAFLVTNGADINAKDNGGVSAYIIALQYEHEDIADYLASHGASTHK